MTPGYARLADHADALGKSLRSYCRAPATDGLAAPRESFHAAMDAWQRVQHLRHGPMEGNTRHPRIQFWPDKRGRVTQSVRLPADRHHLLSIRHIDVASDGTVAFGCQDQGPAEDAPPLVGRHRPGELAPVLFDTPASVRRAMRGYVGSVTLDPAGEVVGASAPSGGVMAFWQFVDGRFLGTLELADGCGLAPGAAPGRFIASSGRGRMVDYDARQATAAEIDLEPMERMSQWDHHMLVVPA